MQWIIQNIQFTFFSVIKRGIDSCRILGMTPVALPQHRAGAGLTSPGSQFQELRIVQ